MMTGRFTEKMCIYCKQAQSTRRGDHVPPQCFFPKPRHYPLIQVPCCRRCNAMFARDDQRVYKALILKGTQVVDYNRPFMLRFMTRLAKALLYYKTGLTCDSAQITRINDDLTFQGKTSESFGDYKFRFMGIFSSVEVNSSWFIEFYENRQFAVELKGEVYEASF